MPPLDIMFWLYLLGLVTFLGIVVRRLLRRQTPMMDDLFSKCVAIDHVHDGVAWVSANGLIDYANPALAKMLDMDSARLRSRSWFDLFTPEDRFHVKNAYSQMLLSGKAWLEVKVLDSHGAEKSCHLLIVAVHDHKTRLSGHYAIIDDRAHAETPEDQLAIAAR